MKWKKLGLIYVPSDDKNSLFYSHSTSPIPIYLYDNIFRIFFSTRDFKGRARPYYLDMDIETLKIIEINYSPYIKLGEIGSFDENGIILTSILNINSLYHFYYVGFPRTAKMFYSADSGVAFAKNEKFDYGATKKYRGPIKSNNKNEPFFSSVQFVIKENKVFKMWYVSGVKWEETKDGLKHFYNIKYCQSSNGIDWSEGIVAIDFKNEYEYALARPCIIKDDKYKMWYSYRAQKDIDTYRIGYAESDDGINWIRKDEEVGIDVSKSGWDSEMICYPYIFDHNGKRYMLYNGNGYGKTGFGIAVLEQD